MGSGSPCASCKLLRRRCTKDCIFAPFFPADDPHKFAIVHKVFGASNVSKMLQELPAQQQGDAVSSLVYEVNDRMRDPVYG
uniref:LOB domain-containing protein n=1 Tax=Oryza rufipogon TaxID=4529 RepID=A0A0E0N782_ORYRU